MHRAVRRPEADIGARKLCSVGWLPLCDFSPRSSNLPNTQWVECPMPSHASTVTGDHSVEALKQQAATAQVLAAISRRILTVFSRIWRQARPAFVMPMTLLSTRWTVTSYALSPTMGQYSPGPQCR